MGTRAIITVKEKPFIATHWDGYPMELGADLMKTKTITQIIKAAQKHSIDFADVDNPAFKPVMEARFKNIAKKAKKPVSYIKDLYKRGKMVTFTVMTSDDYPLESIKNYGDWAEWQYDYGNGKWKARKLHGEWPKSKKNAGPWLSIPELIREEKIRRAAYEKKLKAEEAAKKK